ncbi:hypothetical protein HanHA300_Chr02g0063671 [Helianthus annuus]|nr:hypothetical protein HanHA300_Chr02g0063671 [Helianthus annuus]KAJ0619508.1 hypothetical protein HanHA89_Chr02g0072121 [Helianthus annuus]KAJ0777970.1 hypothetical protein HanLR1_Chr02g0066571 [Helianthus annuus]KAJ0786980.1 hypothetical protein HanOQP8_Chr02g0077401 [Helianthus annuus]
MEPKTLNFIKFFKLKDETKPKFTTKHKLTITFTRGSQACTDRSHVNMDTSMEGQRAKNKHGSYA